MDKYEVICRDPNNHRWSLFLNADNFAHAEEQAIDLMFEHGQKDEIISIDKDFKND